MVIEETLARGLCNTLGRKDVYQTAVKYCNQRNWEQRDEYVWSRRRVDLSHHFLGFDNIGFRTFSNPDFPEQTNLRRPKPRAIFLSESVVTRGSEYTCFGFLIGKLRDILNIKK